MGDNFFLAIILYPKCKAANTAVKISAFTLIANG
jgi:hypothetical protein